MSISRQPERQSIACFAVNQTLIFPQQLNVTEAGRKGPRAITFPWFIVAPCHGLWGQHLGIVCRQGEADATVVQLLAHTG